MESTEPNERGWYDDPRGVVGELRYWDGFRWHDQTIRKDAMPAEWSRDNLALLHSCQLWCKLFVALTTIAGLALVAYTIKTEIFHLGSFAWDSWIFYTECCFLLSYAIARPIRYWFLNACAKSACSMACKGVCAAYVETAASFPEKGGGLKRLNEGACSRAKYLARYYRRKYRGMSQGSLFGALAGAVSFLFVSGPWTGAVVVVATFLASMIASMVVGGRLARRNAEKAPELAAIVSAVISDLRPVGDEGEIAMQEEVAWKFVPFGSYVD